MLSRAACKARVALRSVPFRQASSDAAAATSSAGAAAARQFTYFDNFEVKDGIAIIRFNGPNKMNTISAGMQADAERIFKDHVLPNKDIKAVVFISSKPDNFIAGADIDMLQSVQDKSQLKDMTLKAHSYFEEIKVSTTVLYCTALLLVLCIIHLICLSIY